MSASKSRELSRRFGELRSVLHGEPSVAVFEALQRELDDWPVQALRHSALPYVLSHLSAWPDDLRRTPRHVARAYFEGQPVALLPLYRELDLRNQGIDDRQLASLVARPSIAQFRGLLLHSNIIGPPGIEALAQARNLDQLRRLSLDENLLGPDGAALLTRAPWLHQLETLSLWGNAIALPGVQALARCATLANLRELNIGYNRLGPSSLEAIGRAAWLGSLQTLNLDANHLHDGPLEGLVTGARKLEVLRLQENRLDDRVFVELAKLDHLRELVLCYNDLEMPKGLAQAPWLDTLRRLELSRCNLHDEALAAALGSRTLPQLERLQLSHNALSAPGANLLAQRVGPSLRDLYLGYNHLGDAGVEALLDRAPWPNLHALGLQDNHIGDAGLLALAQHSELGPLEHLLLSGNPLGETGLHHLAHHAPHLAQLRRLELGTRSLSAQANASIASSPYFSDKLKAAFRHAQA